MSKLGQTLNKNRHGNKLKLVRKEKKYHKKRVSTLKAKQGKQYGSIRRKNVAGTTRQIFEENLRKTCKKNWKTSVRKLLRNEVNQYLNLQVYFLT